MQTSRRRFLQYTASGIAITITPLRLATAAVFEDEIAQMPPSSQAGRLKRRIDGLAKVTGSKVFARDIRARDMTGWPEEQAHAFIIWSQRADAPFLGLDLAPLGAGLQPDALVTAEDTHKARLDFSDAFTYGDNILLATGKVPLFLGYPLAILVYHDFARFAAAKRACKAQHSAIVHYGATTSPVARDPYANFRFVRVEGPGGGQARHDVFNAVDDGYVFASYADNQPVWPQADAHGDVQARGMAHAQAIRAELAQPPAQWRVLEREYYSPYIDAAALETDNCNMWYDPATQRLEMVIASQSPHEVMTGTAAMLAASTFKVTQLAGHPAYTVGYGTKEHSPFPYYGVLAALHAPGRPVRLALDREEHFQTAIKRHSLRMRYRMAVDPATLKIQSFAADLDLDGGGRPNYTGPVTQVAAGEVQGVYYLPRNDIVSVGRASRAPLAGSVRGFGSLEAQIGTEVFIEEMAQELGVDSMDLRLANVLDNNARNVAGGIPLTPYRVREIIEADRKRPVWVQRDQRKQRFEQEHPALKYGVGYAVAKKGIGNSNEGIAASVSLSPEGKIHLRHIAVEIGTGSSSTQALLCARHLGRPADDIETAALDWAPLELYETRNPFAIDRAYQERMAADPRWTPVIASASSATNSAFYFSHATLQASRLIYEHGLLPAAAALWGISPQQAAAAQWNNGQLTLAGQRPLALEQLAQKAHAGQGVTGAMVHAFDRWGWAQADYTIQGKQVRLPLDALALQNGSDAWTRIERRNVRYMDPELDNSTWNRFTPLSALVELTINRGTGEVRILSHHSTLECGLVLVPELVAGQIEGGIAMAIGHALYEGLPHYEDGPGAGGWNFNRYRLPRARNVPVWTQTLDILPATADTQYPKGVAEVAQIPTIPAVVNAVAHATGHRLRELPLTPDTLKEVLS